MQEEARLQFRRHRHEQNPVGLRETLPRFNLTPIVPFPYRCKREVALLLAQGRKSLDELVAMMGDALPKSNAPGPVKAKKR